MTRLLRRAEVEVRTGLKRSSIYAAIKAGTFPKPIAISARSVGWLEGELDAWISARIEDRSL